MKQCGQAVLLLLVPIRQSMAALHLRRADDRQPPGVRGLGGPLDPVIASGKDAAEAWKEAFVAHPPRKVATHQIGRTADGKTEAETNVYHWVPPGPEPIPDNKDFICDPLCHPLEMCWQGKCIWRPWDYAAQSRNSCYPNPQQPGLSETDKLKCKTDEAIADPRVCTAAAEYCQWRTDAPDWYRRIQAKQESVQYDNWRRDQELMKDQDTTLDWIKGALRNAPPPGNPTYNQVLPDKALYGSGR